MCSPRWHHRYLADEGIQNCWHRSTKDSNLNLLKLRRNLDVIGKAIANNARWNEFRDHGKRRYKSGVPVNQELRISPYDVLNATTDFHANTKISADSIKDLIIAYTGGVEFNSPGVVL